MYRFIIFVVFVAILTGCSVNLMQDDKLLILENNLQKWEKFRFDGVIEINHQNLSLHKYFTLRKEDEIARLDIYDSGLLGMKPNPFISVYYDSLIQARVPDSAEIKVLRPEDYPDYFSYFLLFKTLNDLKEKKNEIMREKQYRNDFQEFYFDDQQRIERVLLTKDNIEILLTYKGDLQEIKIRKGLKEIANLTIDDVSFEFSKISPLIK